MCPYFWRFYAGPQPRKKWYDENDNLFLCILSNFHFRSICGYKDMSRFLGLRPGSGARGPFKMCPYFWLSYAGIPLGRKRHHKNGNRFLCVLSNFYLQSVSGYEDMSRFFGLQRALWPVVIWTIVEVGKVAHCEVPLLNRLTPLVTHLTRLSEVKGS
jgi:hypothetical protein